MATPVQKITLSPSRDIPFNKLLLSQSIRVRHESWSKALPKESADLWDALQEWDGDSRAALFAHIVSLSVNAVYEPWNRRPRAAAHADRLAQAVDLDMAAAGWKPSVDNFLGRVTKARILQAVSQAKGQRAADRIEHLKKGDMAAEAQTLLADTGWLPEPLRTVDRCASKVEPTLINESVAAVEQSTAIGGETAMVEDESFAEDEVADDAPHAVAAE